MALLVALLGLAKSQEPRAKPQAKPSQAKPSLLATAGTTGARSTGGTSLHKCPNTHSHPEYDSSGDMDEGTARLYAHGHGGINSVKSPTSRAPCAARGRPRRRCAAPRVLPLHPAPGTTPTIPVLVARRARRPPARPPCAAVHRAASRRRSSPPRRAAGCSLPRRLEPMSWPLSCSVSSSATPITRPARCSRPASARGRAADGQRSGCASAQRLIGTRKAPPIAWPLRSTMAGFDRRAPPCAPRSRQRLHRAGRRAR